MYHTAIKKTLGANILYLNPIFTAPSNLLTDDANKIYSFGRMDQNNRLAVILNDDASNHIVTIPAYQLSMINWSSVTDQLTGNTYQVQNGQLTVNVPAYAGAILTA
jgi:alpha-glucosidase